MKKDRIKYSKYEISLLLDIRKKLIQDSQDITMGFGYNYFEELIIWIARYREINKIKYASHGERCFCYTCRMELQE